MQSKENLTTFESESQSRLAAAVLFFLDSLATRAHLMLKQPLKTVHDVVALNKKQSEESE